jgi:hypothetical protein
MADIIFSFALVLNICQALCASLSQIQRDQMHEFFRSNPLHFYCQLMFAKYSYDYSYRLSS